MSIHQLVDPLGIEHEIIVGYDEERLQWSFAGLGFAFDAWPTSDSQGFDHFRLSGWQFEAERQGNDFAVTIWIPSPPSETISEDYFFSKVLEALTQHWDLFGEFSSNKEARK